MSKELNRFLDVAIEAARSAGAIHLFYRDQDFGVSSKSNFSDLVTIVDKKSEEKIREVILGQFPDHAILGEEMGQNREAEHLWVVDPLDGTVNYAHGFPFSCVSIGLEIGGVRSVGVVFDPNRSELFTAIRGQGAFLNGRRIQVSSTPDLMSPALLATGFPYDVASDPTNLEKFSRFLKLGLPVRRPGAAALDISYVACGRLDGFWEYKLNPWDVSAALLILEEAGGAFSAMSGEAFRYGDPLVLSNGRIQQQILEVLK
ncbi:inositol monophosphatase family protein [Deinococcus cellulosilyticus]|uniref:Inositol-1-monophosphatase n=1 Tax=Deinococcus cellulosilyticus (strain DSM 18568 / NBRC 106333 / KACC 11606 / 5516J-15) TaxID=1223518 RepID=A0A511N3C1_DEIC1|nr:inositol monophosphatase family protein [Deinococcus cellulosilyticus]GEM47359.1 inositol monophosphatase [Deinococcus cellulosilyticus NBRC 106333 = KACC 11606]